MTMPRDTTPPRQTGVPRIGSSRKTEPVAFPTLEPFAKRLESLRIERGFTQRTLAGRARISTNHYQDIAHAQANPTVIVLLSLADALGVSVNDLFESPPPASDQHRYVLIADLRDLADAHGRLTDILERFAKDEVWPRPRRARRRPSR